MKIILLSDGTGNAAASVWRTNVWRVFESLERSDGSQVILYDDGVGTSGFLPDALMGLMFGKGLKRNVLHFYQFLCRTYSEGDEIYAFGFSRGAFTIHNVVGLIADQGLVKFKSEGELSRKAEAAYRAYRLGKSESRIHASLRRLLHRMPWSSRTLYDSAENRKIDRIRFVGLWDTVGAYGLPIEEMARGVSRWILSLRLPDRKISKIVQRGCHALSLDDERTTFQPMLWDEREEPNGNAGSADPRNIKDERLSQVWFSGVHANVGGGYPDDSLAHVSLCWMMREAALCGLAFKTSPDAEPDTFKTKRSMRDQSGRLYDSRSGMQRIYRYGPRKVFDLCHTQWSHRPEDLVEVDVPKIHHSVFARIKSGTDQYAPLGLPQQYEVVIDDGSILPSAEHESAAQSRARSELQEHAWDAIWWRRILNLAITAASAFLLIYPLFMTFPANVDPAPLLLPFSDLVRLVGAFVPAFLELWVNAYAKNPFFMLCVVGLIALLSQLGGRLKRKTTDQIRQAWNYAAPDDERSHLPHSLTFKFRTSGFYRSASRAMRLQVAPLLYATLCAAIFIYVTAIAANRIGYMQEDAAGLFCKGSISPQHMQVGETRVVNFQIDQFCLPTGILVGQGGQDERYYIKLDPGTPWSDGNIPTSPSGYTIGDIPGWKRPLLFFAQPFKRVWTRPFFRVVVQIGSSGAEQIYMDPDRFDPILEDNLRPPRSGEVFLYVNDIALAVPQLAGYFYRNNSGTAQFTIRRTR